MKDYTEYAHSAEPDFRTIGTAVLVTIVGNPVIKNDKAKSAAKKTVVSLTHDKLGSLAVLDAIAYSHASDFTAIVQDKLKSSDPDIIAAAEVAYKALHMDEVHAESAMTLGDIPYNEIVKRVVSMKGDPKRGQEMFMQHACFVCHTLSPRDPAKGPMLGGIRERYSRADIVESIIKPSAKIAQGFESQYFKCKIN
jgi:cytochrome c551/c552